MTALHVVLGIAFGFCAGLFFAYALGVITREPWAEDLGRVIDGWRNR